MIVKNLEKKEKSTVEFKVSASPSEFEEALNKAYIHNRSKITVPGFRRGKAPRIVIEGMYGAGVFYDDAIDEIAQSAFGEGVKELALRTVSRPSISDVDIADDKAVTLTFRVEVYPEVKLGQYKELEVYREKAEVTDEMIDAEIRAEQKRNARSMTVERAAALGDTVILDFVGKVDGKAFDGGSAQGFSLELGSGSFIPGFEDQLVGMSAGDDRDINVKFPEYYTGGLADKDAVFECKVHEVKENKLPELDDEFAKDVSEFDTLEEYRADIRAKQQKGREEAIDRAFREDCLDAAIAGMEVEVPAGMLEEAVENQIRNYQRRMGSNEKDINKFLASMGGEPEAMRGMFRVGAERQLKADLLLSRIVEEENIVISGEDVEKAYQDFAESSKMPVEDVKKYLPEESLRNDLAVSRAADLIYDSAKPADKRPGESQEEKPKAAKKTAKPVTQAEETKPAAEKKTSKTAEKKKEAPKAE